MNRITCVQIQIIGAFMYRTTCVQIQDIDYLCTVLPV